MFLRINSHLQHFTTEQFEPELENTTNDHIVEARYLVIELKMGQISEQFLWHKSKKQDVLASRAFFSCYTQVLLVLHSVVLECNS